MATGSYEAWLTTDRGARVASLTDFVRCTASRVANGLGWIDLFVPMTFDKSLVRPDYLIQLWRRPAGGRLKLWNVYLARRWNFETKRGVQYVTFAGPDMLDLLRRRIVARYSGRTEARCRNDYADDVIKSVITDAFTDGAWPAPTYGARTLSNLSVSAAVSLGATISKDYAWQPLLTKDGGGVLPEICARSTVLGTPLFFGIVPNAVSATAITFIVQTWVDQPGADRTSLEFSEQRGNMADPEWVLDRSEEVNYAYAGGRGVGTSRYTQQAWLESANYQSIYGRCEGFVDARNEEHAGVLPAAEELLDVGRPIETFTATPLSTPNSVFGVHWDFGDRVRARYADRLFDPIVSAVTLSLMRGKEEVKAKLEYVAYA